MALDKETHSVSAEDFAGRMMGILNSGALALMISIGHRTGLFDTMATMPPATSGEIAEKAGLNERYVREWLGALLAGDIVTYDAESRRFALPPAHAAMLTRAAAPDNMAAFAQYIPLLGAVEDQIVACFENGGGVSYAAFPRFQDVMADESAQTVVPALVGSILPLMPGLTDRLEQGIEVLDVGCGRGAALNLMARTFPASRFTGYDLSEAGIAVARAEAAAHGTTNVRFAVHDVGEPGGDETGRYDLITAFDAIHDQARPDQVLQRIAAALRPGGVFLMQDIRSSVAVEKNKEHAAGPLLYTISCMHCMTVSLAQGGAGLGAMWGEERAREMLAEAGFARVEVRQLAHDFQNSYYVCQL